jgi:hypothetical protein
MSSQNNTAPILERRYLEEPDACIRAVELLLKSRAKKEATPESRPDDPERRSDEIRAKTSIP